MLTRRERNILSATLGSAGWLVCLMASMLVANCRDPMFYLLAVTYLSFLASGAGYYFARVRMTP